MAEDAVDKILVMIANTKQALEYSRGEDEKDVVLKDFISDANAALEKIEDATKALKSTKIEFENAASSLVHLQNWCERKKVEITGEEANRIKSGRQGAYSVIGGVSACFLVLGTALCCTGVGAVGCVPALGRDTS